MLKIKRKKEKKLHYYKKIIRFVNGNLSCDYESYETRDELATYYYNVLSKKETFREDDDGKKTSYIFNPQNIIAVEIVEKVGEDKEWK